MDAISVPGNKLVPHIKNVLSSGKDFKLMVTGTSMVPFLGDNRDSVLLTAVSNIGIKKGEIVFIQRSSGAYILHRVIKILPDNKFLMNGDAQTSIETVRNDQVFACVKTIYRKGLTFGHRNLVYVLLSRIWMLLLPYRRNIFRLYSRIIPHCKK